MEQQRWHRNPETGKIGKCRAVKRPCRFGEANHFFSEKGAREAEDKSHGGAIPTAARKKPTATGKKSSKSKVRKPDAPRTLITEEEREAFKEENSQLSCPSCNTPATQMQMAVLAWENPVMCRGSGCKSPRYDIYSAKVIPRDHTAPIMLDPKKIGERSWIHMTNTGDNWHDEVSAVDDLVIHAGDYEAAADRMLSENMHRREDHMVNMFTISFKDPESLRVMEPIGEDMNDDILYDMENYDAAAYINRWEAPGTISIEANPRVMQVDKVEKVSMGELRKLASSYNITEGGGSELRDEGLKEER